MHTAFVYNNARLGTCFKMHQRFSLYLKHRNNSYAPCNIVISVSLTKKKKKRQQLSQLK